LDDGLIDQCLLCQSQPDKEAEIPRAQKKVSFIVYWWYADAVHTLSLTFLNISTNPKLWRKKRRSAQLIMNLLSRWGYGSESVQEGLNLLLL
jgi:hypothetical protein